MSFMDGAIPKLSRGQKFRNAFTLASTNVPEIAIAHTYSFEAVPKESQFGADLIDSKCDATEKPLLLGSQNSFAQ